MGRFGRDFEDLLPPPGASFWSVFAGGGLKFKFILIHFSTDCVFDGKKGEYVEEDPPNPILLYSRQKMEIEIYLQKNCDRYCILRLAKVYGDVPGDKTLFTNWIDVLSNDVETIKCAYDQRFSPIYVEDVVSGFISAVEKGLEGIYHLAGPRAHSRMELLEMFLCKYKKYNTLDVNVVGCSIHDFELPEKRPVDVSMKPDKFIAATGLVLSDTETISEQILRNFYNQNNPIRTKKKNELV